MLDTHLRLYIPRAWVMSMDLLILMIDLLVSSLYLFLRTSVVQAESIVIPVGIRLRFYRQSVDDRFP